MKVYYDGIFHVEIANQYHFGVENVYDAKRALLKMIAAEFDTEINKKLSENAIEDIDDPELILPSTPEPEVYKETFGCFTKE